MRKARRHCDATENSHGDLRAEKFANCAACLALVPNFVDHAHITLAAVPSLGLPLRLFTEPRSILVHTNMTVRDMHPGVGIWELGQ